MSFVTMYVRMDTVMAMTTIHLAQRSAVFTILDLPASAFSRSLAMRAMVLSSPVRSTRMSMEPYMFTAPPDTVSPTVTSTGTDSPVTMDAFTDVLPLMTVPSTGMVSPGITRTVDPTLTSSMFITISPSPVITLAVPGLISTSALIPEFALLTVASSRNAPICMMMAISAAASG